MCFCVVSFLLFNFVSSCRHLRVDLLASWLLKTLWKSPVSGDSMEVKNVKLKPLGGQVMHQNITSPRWHSAQVVPLLCRTYILTELSHMQVAMSCWPLDEPRVHLITEHKSSGSALLLAFTAPFSSSKSIFLAVGPWLQRKQQCTEHKLLNMDSAAQYKPFIMSDNQLLEIILSFHSCLYKVFKNVVQRVQLRSSCSLDDLYHSCLNTGLQSCVYPCHLYR